ncbi:carbohydrate sulfotransferase 12 [Kryptolebias marmoratus]|uniref:carbohydrate sulfotransferase 12 n=1 Tax=Kryptolebias marmoratus TaxID=37003 RepID=UPI0007F87647|nr:carbohydrate sulfotransferase 12 [Kryptolebias marmoratus]XP_024864301.1 carbohydrate sulfotransferase 12 [Kryptolebias marmoratus]
MTICGRLIKFFGLLGSVFLILLMSYGWHMSQEKQGRLYQLQDLRKQLVQEQCQEHKKANLKGNSLEDLSQSKLKNFIVDDKHGIIYCYIPKVACTNWKRVLYALNQGEPYPDLVSIKSSTVHKQFKFTLLNDYSRTEIKAKLRHYTKFLFVRDPFVRLVSAYRDKFLHNDPYFYENYGRNMLRLYNNQPDPPKTEKAFRLGIRPSFYNFIQYLLDPQTERSAPFEPHWRQMHRLCHPCLIEYDFIGHQETLQDDAQELLKMLKLEDSITFPSAYENVTDRDFLLNWFRAAPLEDRRKLYELYEQDFRLFGYRRPSELLDD